MCVCVLGACALHGGRRMREFSLFWQRVSDNMYGNILRRAPSLGGTQGEIEGDQTYSKDTNARRRRRKEQHAFECFVCVEGPHSKDSS